MIARRHQAGIPSERGRSTALKFTCNARTLLILVSALVLLFIGIEVARERDPESAPAARSASTTPTSTAPVTEPSPLEQIDEIELDRAATQDACATAADLDLAPEVAGPECQRPRDQQLLQVETQMRRRFESRPQQGLARLYPDDGLRSGRLRRRPPGGVA